MNLRVLTILLFACLSAMLHAQSAVIPGEYIIQLENPRNSEGVSQELKQTHAGWQTEFIRPLSRRFGIWLISINVDLTIDHSAALRSVKGIAVAQPNHVVELRSTTPDDSFFSQQWSLKNTGQGGGIPGADIDADLAWDITTGGVTGKGDTIVVAVIDAGFQLNHPDLQGNFFQNRAEIPENNTDDDGNGYIDDVSGWDAYQNDGSLPQDAHGTHVCGIIAANGNNGSGISGVNWAVKILPIAGSSGNEATVVAAYSYAAEMRILYDESDGANGAFVVATNSSFGVNQGDPADFPIWCAFYDTLGAHGILSAGATINSNVNIDENGDIPTACSSAFLISVTNTNRNDDKYPSAGFGIESIDIAAPGTDVYSTITNSGYGNKTGTSMATPHVAGAIALMYSAACSQLIADYKLNPAGIAIRMKDYLLSGAEAIPQLETLVSESRRLNLLGALNQVQSYVCTDQSAPNAAFSGSNSALCPGSSAFFSNASSANATSFLWEFPGGTPAGSTEANPVVNYAQPGNYSVTLIASNQFGVDTLVLNDFIAISNDALRIVFSEGFEAVDFASTAWVVNNPDDSITWKLTTVAGTNPGSRAASISLYNYTGSQGQRDFLISPDFPLNQSLSNELYFEHAYRRRSINQHDSLIVSISTDQGNSWNRILEVSEYGNGTFATNSILSSSFVPASQGEWCTASTLGPLCFRIDLSDYHDSPHARIRFEAVNDAGNNLYIDNVRVQGICGLQQNAVDLPAQTATMFTVFPNPAQHQLYVSGHSGSVTDATLLDISGREIQRMEQLKGDFSISVEAYPSGIYILRLQTQEGMETHRIFHSNP